MVPDPPFDPAGGMPRPQAAFARANRVTLLAGGIAVGLAVAVYFGTPNQHGLTSIWILLFHLTPFLAATIAIGWLDQAWAWRLRLHLILPTACFLVFFTLFVPYLFILFAQASRGESFDELYYTLLMLVPFIILTIALCLRLGGARRQTVIRTAVALLLLQLSGIEDLAVLIIRDLSSPESRPIPEVWDWADHIAVRIGQHPTKYQAYAFIAVHLAAAIAVLAVPGRAVRAVGQRLRLPLRRDSTDKPRR